MSLETILARLDAERRTLATHGGPIEILPRLTRISGASGAWHSIVFSALTADTADAVIDEQVAHYRELHAEVEWKVYRHDAPLDLLDRLAKRGFEIGACEAVLVLDLASRPDWIDTTDMRGVVRAATTEHLEWYRRAAEAIFDTDRSASIDELAANLRNGSTAQVGYLSLVGGMAVSVARLYTHPESHFGGLYGGGTLREFRGQGHYRATVAARCRDAAVQGARYMLVDALPTSRAILERLGFVHLTDTWPCVWRP